MKSRSPFVVTDLLRPNTELIWLDPNQPSNLDLGLSFYASQEG